MRCSSARSRRDAVQSGAPDGIIGPDESEWRPKEIKPGRQETAQEIRQFGRRVLKPVIFVLNNSGYLIGRLLRKVPILTMKPVRSPECKKRASKQRLATSMPICLLRDIP